MRVGLTYPSFLGSVTESFKNVDPSIQVSVINTYEDLEACDLVAFPGGEDVNPEMYSRNNTSSMGINRNRDTREEYLYKEAHKLNKKMFGMCRGLQFLAVMLGNVLVQDIYRELEQSHGGSHDISTIGDSIISKNFTSVNSLHHQGLLFKDEQTAFRLAHSNKYLMITSYYKNIVESFQTPNIIATQFHPEFMMNRESASFFEDLCKWVEGDTSIVNADAYYKTINDLVAQNKTKDCEQYNITTRLSSRQLSSNAWSTTNSLLEEFSDEYSLTEADNNEDEEEE